MQPRGALLLIEGMIKSRPSNVTLAIDGFKLHTCFDCDRVDRSPPDPRASINTISSDALGAATSLENAERKVSPTQRKSGQIDGYIR